MVVSVRLGDPASALVAVPPGVDTGGRLRVPGWLVLIWQNRKSRVGMLMVASMVLLALIAPLITVAHPNDFNLLATKQAPSWHHLFGTTDQGSDIFSQVALGARNGCSHGGGRDPSRSIQEEHHQHPVEH